MECESSKHSSAHPFRRPWAKSQVHGKKSVRKRCCGKQFKVEKNNMRKTCSLFAMLEKDVGTKRNGNWEQGYGGIVLIRSAFVWLLWISYMDSFYVTCVCVLHRMVSFRLMAFKVKCDNLKYTILMWVVSLSEFTETFLSLWIY